MKYRPSNCKKCGGKMQVGGPTYQNQAQLDAANAEARRFAMARGLDNASQVYSGTRVGDPVAQYLNPDGTPYISKPTKSLATRLPAGASIQTENGAYWYNDPVTGDVIDFDPGMLPKQQHTQQQIFTDLSNRNLNKPIAMRMRGGRLQIGGTYDDKRGRQFNYNPLGNVDVPQDPRFVNEQNVVGPPQPYSDLPQPDRIQEGIGKGIIQTPNGYDSGQQWYDEFNQVNDKKHPATPSNWKQSLGIGIMGLRALGSEISGRVARSRQNQYDYTQQASLGMLNPMPTNDYQPNPYSLYARYGGSLKNYMKYGGLQHVDYFGPPFSNGATYKFSDEERYDKTSAMKVARSRIVGTMPIRQTGGEVSRRPMPSYSIDKKSGKPNKQDSLDYKKHFDAYIRGDQRALDDWNVLAPRDDIDRVPLDKQDSILNMYSAYADAEDKLSMVTPLPPAYGIAPSLAAQVARERIKRGMNPLRKKGGKQK